MEKHHSSEFNSSSTSQEIPCILLNPKDHYPFQKSLLLATSPSQINPVYILPSYIFMNHLILCAHLYTGLLSHPLPSHFPTKIPYAFLISPVSASYHAHLIIIDLIIQQYSASIDHEALHYIFFLNLLSLPQIRL